MSAFLKSISLTLLLAIIYVIALYWIIVLKFNITAYHEKVTGNINWIPYREAVLYGNLDLVETLLNILIFIPLGLYTGVMLRGWNFGQKVLLFFSLSFLFETSQYVLEVGAFDITDLINNTLGGIVGLTIYSILVKSFKNVLKTQKFINILCLVGTVLVFSFLLFLKMNNLWIFRMQLLGSVGSIL